MTFASRTAVPSRFVAPGLLLLLALVALFGGGCSTGSPGPTLTVALSPDIPPYVLDDAGGGLEVELLRAALPGHRLRFVQLPYEALQTAVPGGRTEVSAGVQDLGEDGVFYSRDFVTFVNVAATRRTIGTSLDTVADLAGHRVLTWQGAYRELGPEFERLFAPGAPEHGRYVEVADQRDQVREFWASPDAVIVIDRAILRALSEEMGHDPGSLDQARLFPPATDFKVAFADPALRDAFDRGLRRLCDDGGYGRLLARYEVEVPPVVCGD